MKVPFRLIAVLAILMLALPVAAQDQEAEDFTVEEADGVIAITLTEGTTLEATEDGYLLTIESALDFAPSYSVTPAEGYNTFNYPLLELQGDWDYAEELTASATLDLNENSYEFDITAPTFDAEAGTLTFSVPEIEGIEMDKDGNPVLPEIESGSLMIRLNGEVLSGLRVGRFERINSTRSSYIGCCDL